MTRYASKYGITLSRLARGTVVPFSAALLTTLLSYSCSSSSAPAPEAPKSGKDGASTKSGSSGFKAGDDAKEETSGKKPGKKSEGGKKDSGEKTSSGWGSGGSKATDKEEEEPKTEEEKKDEAKVEEATVQERVELQLDLTIPYYQQVQDIFQAKCFECHGANGRQEGGIGNVVDLKRMRIEGRAKPGEPNASPLYVTIEGGAMPPDGSDPMTDAEKNTVKMWIQTGAVTGKAVIDRPFYSEFKMLQDIEKDYNALPAGDQKNARYIVLHHLYNAGVDDGYIQTVQLAVSKALNSLSQNPAITKPKIVGTTDSAFPKVDDKIGLILRVDISKYSWDEATWTLATGGYPYTMEVPNDTVFRKLRTAMANDAANPVPVPIARADWFARRVSAPPVYNKVLKQPDNLDGLETLLNFKLNDNIVNMNVKRAGMTKSLISENHRVIERHQTPAGAFYRSYEFGTTCHTSDYGTRAGCDTTDDKGKAINTDRKDQDLTKTPLGPRNPNNGSPRIAGVSDASDFWEDGGEFIYQLPNKLFAFYVAGADRQRLDGAPDVTGSDGKSIAVTLGLVCMRCHNRGLIPAIDTIRDRAGDFTGAEKAAIERIYLPVDKFKTQIRDDSTSYSGKLKETGVDPLAPDPINTVADRFNGRVDLYQAAAELNWPPEALRAKLNAAGTTIDPAVKQRLLDGTEMRQSVTGGAAGFEADFGNIRAAVGNPQ